MLSNNSRRVFAGIIILFSLLGNGCETTDVSRLAPLEQAETQEASDNGTTDCVLPGLWKDVIGLFKDCKLKEVESGAGYELSFNPEGGNGVFEYCNTLLFRRYETVKGDLYTYEKVRYQHYPNSEAGEYRIAKDLFDRFTNARPCTPIDERFAGLSDDELSEKLFPSRNYLLGEKLADVNVLPNDDDVPVPTSTVQSPNGTYTNTYGNEVPSPYYAPSVPAGASARCGDGTYSFSQSRRGTCSHHGGVAEWF